MVMMIDNGMEGLELVDVAVFMGGVGDGLVSGN